MKVFSFICLLAVTTAICVPVFATPPAGNQPAGFRLTIELRDGSRIVGKSTDSHFQFHSDVLGGMNLPLEKIRAIERQARTNLATLTTVGADSLTVEFAMKDIRVETSFGNVKLPVDMIKSVRVSALRQAGRPADGLIGLWSGEGNAVDSAGGNNGVLQNVSFTDGVVGQAFLFAPDNFPNGTWVGVQIPDAPAYELTHSLTIEAWIRPRGNGYVIFFRGDHRPGLDPYCLALDGRGNLGFNVCGEDGNTVSVRASIGRGAWIHVAGVLDDSADTMSLYTNGVLAAQITTTVRPFAQLLANESPGIGIGNVNDGGNNFPFVGEIDEVGLYNRALSEDEVNAIYTEHEADADSRAEPLPTRTNPNIRLPMGSAVRF